MYKFEKTVSMDKELIYLFFFILAVGNLYLKKKMASYNTNVHNI